MKRRADEVVLVFDMDGTLLDGRAAVIDAVAAGLADTYRHFHLPLPAIKRERIAIAIGLPSPLFFREAYEPQTVPLEIHDRFAGEFEVRSTRAEIAALQQGETDLYAGVEMTLQALAERGHPMALFSNASAPYFEAVVRVHALQRFFGRTLSLESAVRQRLARDKAGIVEHLATEAPAAVVIGDRIHDIHAGHSVGARTVGCLYGFGGPEELRAADWKIEQITEILSLPLTASATPRQLGRAAAQGE